MNITHRESILNSEAGNVPSSPPVPKAPMFNSFKSCRLTKKCVKYG